MSDKTITLSSFKYGLDGRRDVLASVAGTLTTLINGFVNSGGEIEQRLTFRKIPHNWPFECFGLETTDQGLVTFGSATPPLSGPLPSGVSYVQLIAPRNGGAMTKVVFSCNFEGKAFVLARFDNTDTVYAFYDGKVVGPFINGIVGNDPGLGGPENSADLAIDLAAQINLLPGWIARPNTNKLGGAAPGFVTVTSPPGIHLTPVPSTNSANGFVGVQLVDQSNPDSSNSIAGVAAHSAFTIAGSAAGTITVIAPKFIDGSGVVTLCGPINWTVSDNATATAIVAAINANTLFYGYSAVTNGPIVTIFAPTAFGSFGAGGINLTVNLTGAMVAVAAASFGSFTASLSPSNIDVTKFGKSGSFQTVSGSITVKYSGASGAVTFLWEETDAGGNVLTAPIGILISNKTGASASFAAFLTVNQTKTTYARCTVKDAGTGTTVVLQFFVSLALESNA